jgi:transcriptional regulator with XRE-family HTH domain
MRTPDNQHCRRIKQARERLQLEPQGVADAIGMNYSSYWDLETVEPEITIAVSLRQIIALCNMLKLPPGELFTGLPQAKDTEHAMNVQALVQLIPDHQIAEQLTLAEFEGWRLEEVLSNPDSALESWNLDCLRDVAAALGVNSLVVLNSHFSP